MHTDTQTCIHTSQVLEALRFSAFHRLPSRMSREEKERVVEAVIDMVELRPILGKQIGMHQRTYSRPLSCLYV
jgi:hypothetical protein